MVGSRRQRVGEPSLLPHHNLPVPATTPVPILGVSRRNMPAYTTGFANSRGGLAGVGLTSGLKVSQPTNSSGLDASVRP